MVLRSNTSKRRENGRSPVVLFFVRFSIFNTLISPPPPNAIFNSPGRQCLKMRVHPKTPMMGGSERIPIDDERLCSWEGGIFKEQNLSMYLLTQEKVTHSDRIRHVNVVQNDQKYRYLSRFYRY